MIITNLLYLIVSAFTNDTLSTKSARSGKSLSHLLPYSFEF